MMFCPECRAEYRKRVTECADCKVALLPGPPPEPESHLPPEREGEFVDYEQVLSTFNHGHIALMKSILDSEGLTYFFKGEHSMFIPLAIDSAKLMVRKDQAERARELLKELKLTYMPIPAPREPEQDERA